MKSVTFCSGIVLLGMVSTVNATETSVPFIYADQVHAQLIDGFGVTVAVIDTGVDYADPGLAFDIAPGGISFINGVPVWDGGQDPNGPGHGTLASLIITDASGVAPFARILPIRVRHPVDIAMAINYVIQRKAADPTIRVINISAGIGEYTCPCDNTDDITKAYQLLIQSALSFDGIVTFAATGNDAHCGDIKAPACVSAAVKVAAEYDGDYGFKTYPECDDPAALPHWVACFSHVAEGCDYFLAAPGCDITVGGFSGVNGTSAAAPHCAGVAALMFSKNPCDLGGLVREIIFNTATTYEWAYPWCYLSPQPKHVNALAAVNAVSGPTCAVVGDLDCDGRVSGYDLPGFETCMSGARAVS